VGLVVLAASIALLLGSTLPAMAVTSSLYAASVTDAGGLVWMGTHLWVADRRLGLCRLDGPAPDGGFAVNPDTCSRAAGAPGQPAYDAVKGLIYVPDKAADSPGVWRLEFDAATETVRDPVLVAPHLGLVGLRPTAAAVGRDHNLYVGSSEAGLVQVVTNPDGGPSSQQVQTVGKTLSGGGVSGLAFIGEDLYLAEGGAVTRIQKAVGCRPSAPCPAGATPIQVSGPTALASDGINQLWIADTRLDRSDVVRYTLSTSTQDVYTNSGVLSSSVTTSFKAVTGLTLDPTGHLYMADDPSGGRESARGRVWRVTPGALAF
jgi:hypothetical protein